MGIDEPLARFRRSRARALRENAVSAERVLWRALGRVPLAGTHFRRQVPLGRYVVDFACLAAKLVIEVDGPSHTDVGAIERDRLRQAWLRSQGFRVLRFWNEEVYADPDGVLATIYAALHGGLASDPMPFRQGRRAKLSREGHPTPDLRSDPPHPGEGEALRLPPRRET